MTTPDDDRFAEAFRRSLGTGPDVDADAALFRVTARSRVVRRRRMAVRAGGLLAAAATVLALWMVVQPGDDATIETVDRPSTSGLTSSSVAPSTAAPSTASSVPATAPTPAVTGSSVPGATTGPTATGNPATPANPTTPPTGPVVTTVAPTSPPATPPPSIGPTTYSGLGGSMTVRVDAGNLVLVGVQPAAGYTITEQEADEGEAEVRFENGGARTRIRVRLEDGALVPEIDET